jgi:hypothetical protein
MKIWKEVQNGPRTTDHGRRTLTTWLLPILFLSTVYCLLSTTLLGQTAAFQQPNTSPPVVVTNIAWGGMVLGNPGPTQSVIFQNTGTTSLTVTSISISGGNSGDFAVSSTVPATNCGTTLTAAATCTINVTFTPQAAGSRSSSLSVSATGLSGSPQTIALTGFGIVLNATPTQPTFLYSDTATGTTNGLIAILTTSNCPSVVSVCATTPATSTTAGGVGIVVSGGGKGTMNSIASTEGAVVNCTADGTITAGHYIIFGSTTGGACKDGGATTPASGEIFGLALAAATVGGSFPVLLNVTKY